MSCKNCHLLLCLPHGLLHDLCRVGHHPCLNEHAGPQVAAPLAVPLWPCLWEDPEEVEIEIEHVEDLEMGIEHVEELLEVQEMGIEHVDASEAQEMGIEHAVPLEAQEPTLSIQ